MNYETITDRLKRVTAIVNSWKGVDGVPQIERDIALEELRAVYNELLVVDAEEGVGSEESDVDDDVEVEVVIAPSVEEESMVEERTSVTSDVASMEAFYDALDIDALLGINDEPAVEQPAIEEDATDGNAEPAVEPEPEPAVAEESAEEVAENIAEEQTSVTEPEPTPISEPEQAPTPNTEPIAEPTPKPIAEPTPKPIAEPVVAPVSDEPKPIGAGLFDLNDIPVRSRSKRKMISLYSDNPISASAEPVKRESKTVESEPIADVVPAEESAPVAESVNSVAQQRLGDSFGEVKTLADHIAKDDAPTTPFNRITELRQAIGLNDKFLMIRDLFGGDAERYEATIDTLDEFDDLDECIIYIVENFRWNPDLEAAKLLVSLIERKLA